MKANEDEISVLASKAEYDIFRIMSIERVGNGLSGREI